MMIGWTIPCIVNYDHIKTNFMPQYEQTKKLFGQHLGSVWFSFLDCLASNAHLAHLSHACMSIVICLVQFPSSYLCACFCTVVILFSEESVHFGRSWNDVFLTCSSWIELAFLNFYFLATLPLKSRIVCCFQAHNLASLGQYSYIQRPKSYFTNPGSRLPCGRQS
jgi:hypothetical protein